MCLADVEVRPSFDDSIASLGLGASDRNVPKFSSSKLDSQHWRSLFDIFSDIRSREIKCEEGVAK